MKTKLTVTIDEELLPKAKEHARSLGVSLSQLIEQALRDLSEAEALLRALEGKASHIRP